MVDASGNRRNDANGYYINIEGYYDKIHRTTWVRRTSGMLAGATLGAAYGAVGGLAAAFVPAILSAIGVAGVATGLALPAMGAVAASVGLFAAITATIGMAITADVAANAASSAVGLEEKERREKLERINESGKDAGPDASLPAKKSAEEKEPPFFNWKVAVVTVPLFAAFGALIAYNPFTAAEVFKKVPLFAGLEGAAAVTASASVFGIFGAFLGLKSSLFTNQLANFYYKVLSGALFDKEPRKEAAVQVKRESAGEKAMEHAIDEPSPSVKSFAASEKVQFSLQRIIEKSESRNPDQEIVLTR